MSAPKDDGSFQGKIQETLIAESFSTLETLKNVNFEKCEMENVSTFAFHL